MAGHRISAGTPLSGSHGQARTWQTRAKGVHSPDMAKGPLVVYAYANCSTCRDAIAWLKEHRVTFTEKAIYTDPPSVPELRRMLDHQGGNLRKLFNTSGLVYRELGLAAKLPQMSLEDALALLAANGRLVKRPFLLGPNTGLVGFDPKTWAGLV